VFVVGNPVIDTLVARGVRRVPPAERSGVLVTAHRPTNVDDPVRLARLVGVVRALAEQVGPVTFPVHPRTAARLEATGLGAQLEHPGITLTGPAEYDVLLGALASARLAVTDSGGIQEEAAYLGVPVVVLRGSTPRWEGVEAGTTTLAGLADDHAAAAVLSAAAGHTSPEGQERAVTVPCPYGDGTTGPQVAAVLADERTDALLALDEPDFTDGSLPW
jgi:UDP-N-acetylglucosamine 2-epimerase (non-hydrolysing)